MQSASIAVVFAISIAAADAAPPDEVPPQSAATKPHRRCHKIERDIEAIDLAGYASGAAVLDVLVTDVVPSVTAMNGVQSACGGIILDRLNSGEIEFRVPSAETEDGVLADCAAPAPCQVGVVYHLAATLEEGELWVRRPEHLVAIDDLLDATCATDITLTDRDGR